MHRNCLIFGTKVNLDNIYTLTSMKLFGQFLTKMGKTGIFFNKAFGTFFSLLKALINCKVSEVSNEGIPKKCEKPPFLGILGQNGQFWTVFGQNGQNA